MIESFTTAAAAAAREFGSLPPAQRRTLLYECAVALETSAEAIIAVAIAETGLTRARLSGELARTCGQLRTLGDFVAEGKHLPGISSPGAAPGGGDITMTTLPIGPVAVFAASNFPLAFGVAGGDTASALAAGCPVVVKAHPAQPRTSRLIGELMTTTLPAGVFAMVAGDNAVSIALVEDPAITAVGFTGSLAGGRALLAAAAARPDPIPVYAEMGSLNPVFVLADAAGSDQWPQTLANAVTGSAGQLCTKPGLIVVPDSPSGAAMESALAEAITGAAPHQMLTDGMAREHQRWHARAGELSTTQPQSNDTVEAPVPFAVRIGGEDLSGEFLEEHFGPSTVICRAPLSDYPELAGKLNGSLTATVIGSDHDLSEAATLLPRLAEHTGRLIWNGVPTGVAVCDAMLHGGPWPATSAPQSTSVGTAAVQRFRRPIALQGLPTALLTALPRG